MAYSSQDCMLLQLIYSFSDTSIIAVNSSSNLAAGSGSPPLLQPPPTSLTLRLLPLSLLSQLPPALISAASRFLPSCQVPSWQTNSPGSFISAEFYFDRKGLGEFCWKLLLSLPAYSKFPDALCRRGHKTCCKSHGGNHKRLLAVICDWKSHQKCYQIIFKVFID